MRQTNLIISAIIVCSMGSMGVPAISLAGGREALVDRAGFSVQETRQFTSSVSREKSADFSGANMPVAKMSDDFDCPIFSNSPYSDIAEALDSLQTSINVFPKCSAADSTNDAMSKSSVELRQQILDAQDMQNKGETQKLGLSAEKILTSATKLQELISNAATAPCYKTADSKNLIFSINDVFQSIAPLALDLATKNPSLGPMLAPYLPVVAGAKAVSKGLSVLEAALKYMPTIDMTVQENRMAVIKNTCSFMKVYNKVEYLTMDRASRLKKINQDFGAQIKRNLEKKRLVSKAAEDMGITFTTSVKDASVIKIKQQAEKYKDTLGKATDELGVGGKSSAISVCAVVKTVFAMKTGPRILNDLVELARILDRDDEIAFKKNKLVAFEAEMGKAETLNQTSTCAERGQEWIGAQKEALAAINALLAEYEARTESNTQAAGLKVQILQADKEAADADSAKKKIVAFADLSVFEPGELEKRMRDLPSYLFNGPTDAVTRWNPFTSVTPYLQRKGPVFDLLRNNEDAFNLAITSFKRQVSVLQKFEYLMMTKEYDPRQRTSPLSDPIVSRFEAEKNQFAHLSVKFAPVDSLDYRPLCDAAKLAIKAYVSATDQLISDEYLCKMIDPVLKEESVSMWLKRYCQDARGIVSDKTVKAGYKELARPLFAAGGPKEQIEVIMQKRHELDCPDDRRE